MSGKRSRRMGFALVVNDDDSTHQDGIAKLFRDAERFDCLVAFATYSGFKWIESQLKSRLDDPNFRARFLVGLDFYHTEPGLLDTLLAMSKKHGDKFIFYISGPDRGCVYHPKVYAFYHGAKETVVIGSANLTQGGLSQNYEMSVCLEGQSGVCGEDIETFIASLIEDDEMVPATNGASLSFSGICSDEGPLSFHVLVQSEAEKFWAAAWCIEVHYVPAAV